MRPRFGPQGSKHGRQSSKKCNVMRLTSFRDTVAMETPDGDINGMETTWKVGSDCQSGTERVNVQLILGQRVLGLVVVGQGG